MILLPLTAPSAFSQVMGFIVIIGIPFALGVIAAIWFAIYILKNHHQRTPDAAMGKNPWEDLPLKPLPEGDHPIPSSPAELDALTQPEDSVPGQEPEAKA